MFKQIIPATGWWLRREVSKGEFIDEPLVAWGLYENPEHDGDAAVTGLVTDPDGLGLCEASAGYYIHQSEIDQERAQVSCKKPLGVRAGAVRKS